MTLHETITDGIAELTIDNPPVNAWRIDDTYELADKLDGYKRDADVRVAIVTATGRGFSAGVDIKEMQALEDNEGILAVNDACFEAFRAVYECAVPVICAVNDFCLGTGIGVAGNADLVIAAEGSRFGLPEVDNGALGALTHLRRLVPQQRARHMLYTCEPAPAEELLAYGTVLDVVPADALMERAREIAHVIASKPGRTIRAAKRSANGIEQVDVRATYRYEQGYTFELNLAGEGDKAREAFIAGDRPSNDAGSG